MMMSQYYMNMMYRYLYTLILPVYLLPIYANFLFLFRTTAQNPILYEHVSCIKIN